MCILVLCIQIETDERLVQNHSNKIVQHISSFCLLPTGPPRAKEPQHGTCDRWLQKDGNSVWRTKQKPYQNRLHKDVLWRTDSRTRDNYILLGYALVSWPTSSWTGGCSVPCHYLCTTVKFYRYYLGDVFQHCHYVSGFMCLCKWVVYQKLQCFKLLNFWWGGTKITFQTKSALPYYIF